MLQPCLLRMHPYTPHREATLIPTMRLLCRVLVILIGVLLFLGACKTTLLILVSVLSLKN